jgi:hypothetical protein
MKRRLSLWVFSAGLCLSLAVFIFANLQPAYSLDAGRANPLQQAEATVMPTFVPDVILVTPTPLAPARVITLTPSPVASTVPSDCPALMLSRLSIGSWGYVATRTPQMLFTNPTRLSPQRGSLPAATAFQVVEGPVCADDAIWWRVTVPVLNISGWMPEWVYALAPLPLKQ